jgi:hypothetical protein
MEERICRLLGDGGSWFMIEAPLLTLAKAVLLQMLFCQGWKGKTPGQQA